jgi:hypothetical protein
MPPLAKQTSGKMCLHLTAIFRFRPSSAATRIQFSDRRTNPQGVTAKQMVMFAVIRRVSQQPVKMNKLCGLSNGRAELRRIVARPACDDASCKKVALDVADYRHLGPATPQKTFVAAPPNIMLTGVTRFQTGGIDDTGGLMTEAALGPGVIKKAVQQVFKSPFFSSRASAFCKVE